MLIILGIVNSIVNYLSLNQHPCAPDGRSCVGLRCAPVPLWPWRGSWRPWGRGGVLAAWACCGLHAAHIPGPNAPWWGAPL